MAKTLGLDLGTNSIGWAIRDDHTDLQNQIIDKGVLTFEKGVGEGKSGEFPMVQKRTESRGKRRHYQAEKYRKWTLLEALIKRDMCPLSVEELNGWRHYTKGIGRRYPKSEAFIQWLRFDFNGDGKPDFEQAGFDVHENHYLFRMLAASEKPEHIKLFKNNPALLGRVFYHLVQRRGFRGRDEAESKTIMEGSKENGTIGVDAIAPYIEKHKTLGAALYYLQKEQGGRIRKRYNLRSDYEAELAEICRVQGIDSGFHQQLWKAIVWQRPLRSQKGTVGYCTLEAPQMTEGTNKFIKSGKKRCPISHPLYEEYRTWVFINNLKIAVPEGAESATFLQQSVYPLFYNASRDFKLSTIARAMEKKGAEITARFPADTKVVSATLLYRFRELLGEDWKGRYGWDAAIKNEPRDCPYSFEDIWHVLATFDSREKLQEFALKKLGLDEEKAESFSKIKLQQGYATLSLSAIKKLLPFLQQGFRNDEAVFMANIPKVLGVASLTPEKAAEIDAGIRRIIDEHETERHSVAVVNGLINDQMNADYQFFKEESDELDNDDVATIRKKIAATVSNKVLEKNDKAAEKAIYQFSAEQYLKYLRKPHGERRHNAFLKTERLHDRIFRYLHTVHGAPLENKKHLWHPSEQETYKNAPEKDSMKLLGDPTPISNGFKNPMALKTLYKLRGLINYLLQDGKIDEDTRIVVEIARELNDANMRKAIEKYQRERERENDSYKKKVDEINAECGTSYNREDKTLLNKIRLWEEQNMRCMYTGEQIKLCDLLNGLKYDFEHTVPASMSFDNELKNLTLANKPFNAYKSKRLPTELPNYYEEATIDGKKYPAIIHTIETLFGERRVQVRKVRGKDVTTVTWDKIEHLRALVDEWKHKSKTASDKGIKDACIQRKHMLRFELDYWRKKLEAFTIKEYKPGWRNSQLRDTQIVTKYALPYLKTVFRKVEVQKGSVTAAFREIYKAGSEEAEKSRDRHSHHAIDAAVLTLIPVAHERDKILERYNDAKDKHQTYHEAVRGWKDFTYSMLLQMEEEILINFQAQHRELKNTKKYVRKRGKQQFVREQMPDGSWKFKEDAEGKRIPLVAKGDTIRGQLHKESFFGAIKQGEDVVLVERYPIASFTSINDCKNIVDKGVREIVQTELTRRMAEGLSFDKAKLEPVPFPNGKAIIKKVRCKVAAGRGYLKAKTALQVHQHDFPSKHEYKRTTYAQNDTNALCLYYEGEVGGKTERAFKIVGLYDLATLRLNNIADIKREPFYATAEVGRGKVKQQVSLTSILQTGNKAMFYKINIGELLALSPEELSQRLYVVYKFNEIGSPYIYLQHHLEARPDGQLGDGSTSFVEGAPRLKLKADKFCCAIEHRDFKVNTDGSINWLISND